MQGSVAYLELDTVGERENVLPLRLEAPRKGPDFSLSPQLPGVKIEFANSIELTLPWSHNMYSSQGLADGRGLQAMEGLGNCVGGIGVGLLQPPLHQRQLGASEVVGQHIEGKAAGSAGKRAAQVGLD